MFFRCFSLIFFLALLFFPVQGSAEVFTDSWHELSIEVDEDDWQSVLFDKTATDNKYLLFQFVDEAALATLNVWAYSYLNQEPVTINGFFDKRRVAGYDGWINVKQRYATDYELQRSRVHDGYVAVFRKDVLGKDLSRDKRLVAEYYYVRANKGYVISLQTRFADWKKVVRPFKRVVQSFFLGKEMEEITPESTIVSGDNWRMLGQGPENRNSIASTFRLRDRLTEEWASFLSRGDRDYPYVLAEDALVSVAENELRRYSISDGAVQWRYALPEGETGPLALSEGIVAFVQTASEPQLHGVLAETGAALYLLPLDLGDYSAPVISGSRLLLFRDGILEVRRLDTGELLFSLDVMAQRGLRPVLDDERIFVVTEDDYLLALDKEDGDELWRERLFSAVLHDPVISDSQVFVLQESKEGLSVFSKGLEDGDAKWRFDDRRFTTLLSPISASGSRLIMAVRSEDGDYLIALSQDKGELIWEYRLPQRVSEMAHGPVFTDQRVFYTLLLRDEQGSPVYKTESVHSAMGHRLMYLNLDDVLEKDTIRIRSIQPFADGLYIRYGRSLRHHSYVK